MQPSASSNQGDTVSTMCPQKQAHARLRTVRLTPARFQTTRTLCSKNACAGVTTWLGAKLWEGVEPEASCVLFSNGVAFASEKRFGQIQASPLAITRGLPQLGSGRSSSADQRGFCPSVARPAAFACSKSLSCSLAEKSFGPWKKARTLFVVIDVLGGIVGISKLKTPFAPTRHKLYRSFLRQPRAG